MKAKQLIRTYNEYWIISIKSTVTGHAPGVDVEFWSRSRVTKGFVELVEHHEKDRKIGINSKIIYSVLNFTVSVIFKPPWGISVPNCPKFRPLEQNKHKKKQVR
jgi:hypothetical protein